MLKIKTIGVVNDTNQLITLVETKEIERINALFESAVEVTSSNGHDWNADSAINLTHKALLIDIQPIEKESAEDLLRDFLGSDDAMRIEDESFLERAKAALEQGAKSD